MIYILIVIAAISKAVMDKVSFHYSISVFSEMKSSFWNPSESWKNKWKDGDKTNGEKFVGSSTVFVFITDAWHLFQSIMISCLFASIVIYKPIFNPIIDFLILKSIFTGTFELLFSYGLSRS